MAVDTGVSAEQARDLYTTAFTIRRFEESVRDLLEMGKLDGLAHLSIGHEAVPTGVCAALRPDDTISSTHRGHGHLIAKGGDLERMFAELFGRETGYCHGRGGSMHIADLDLGILGANGIVGGGIPLAMGAAFAHQRQGTDRVSVAFFGDGGVNQGAFHESLNLAAVWQLPAIFVCENNGYAASVPQSRHQRNPVIADRAIGYGMPGVTVDGNDVFAVYAAAREAVERARAGGGPTLIECKTYRHFSHAGLRAEDRPADEVASWRERDPVLALARYYDSVADDRDQIERRIDGQIEQAISAAESAPLPDPSEMDRGVYGARPAVESAPEPGERVLTYAAALDEAMRQAMESDPAVTYSGEDLESGSRGKGFPVKQVRDTPISEVAIAGLGVGAALAGDRPVVDIMFADFATVAMDQIVNQAAKIRYMLGGEVDVPLVIRMHIGGGVNAAAQHSQSLEAWFAHVPGLTVVYPSTPYDAKGLLLAALDDPNPTIVLDSRQLSSLEGPVPERAYRLPIGKARVLREGSDLTLIAIGPQVQAALTAAEQLSGEGVESEVIDPRSLQPLDIETLARSAEKTGRVIVAHQAVTFGGIGAEIAAQITERCFSRLKAPVVRLGAPFAPSPFASILEDVYEPDQARIVEAARGLLNRSTGSRD
ncbi:MAG: dehydrogenase E1 component subunit alpha/beta [Thermomicrobiales bacterium]